MPKILELNSLTTSDLNLAKVDSPDVGDHSRNIFELINLTIVTSIVCTIGIMLNVINIIVFCKQGMKSTVNISFMVLSITDLINVVLIEWVSISSYPFLVNSQDIVILPREVSYLTGGFPHGCMSRITAWITVYMTAERCLCIALPFKIKTLITPRLTTFVLITIYIFSLLPLIPEYLFLRLGWKYSQQVNRIVIGLLANLDQLHLEGVSFLTYSIMTVTSFIVLICLTIILIVQLKNMSVWRQGAQGKGNQTKALTQKDRMAIRTVLVVACVLIITFTPSFIFCGVCYIVPGFSMNGSMSDSYIIFLSFAFVFDATNASMNTLLYYSMNSSFRKTFREMFCVASTTKTSIQT